MAKRSSRATTYAVVCLGGALLFGLAFLGLYVFRANLYAQTEVEPATLAELYPASTTAMAISGYTIDPGLALIPRLRNAQKCDGWRVEAGQAPSTEVEGVLRIPLQPGIHDYVARPRGCEIREPAIDAVRLNLFFGKAETFGVQDLANDQYQVNSVNLPTVLAPPVPFSPLVPDVVASSSAEAEQARAMLVAEGFEPEAATREKIEFLAAFVRRHMPSGSPPAYLNTMSPWQVFLKGDRDGAGNFCRQWSLTYGYLANLAGIPTRNLFTGGAMEQVDMGSHAFSESYVREEARWAYVDPTNDIAYVMNSDGEVLTGADLYMAIVSGSDGALMARTFDEDGRTVDRPFAAVGKGVRHFMHRDNFLIYVGSQDGRYQLRGTGVERYGSMLYRFLFQPQQYFGYTHFVSYHWVRAATFFTCLVSAAAAVVFGVFGFLRRHPR